MTFKARLAFWTITTAIGTVLARRNMALLAKTMVDEMEERNVFRPRARQRGDQGHGPITTGTLGTKMHVFIREDDEQARDKRFEKLASSVIGLPGIRINDEAHRIEIGDLVLHTVAQELPKNRRGGAG